MTKKIFKRLTLCLLGLFGIFGLASCDIDVDKVADEIQNGINEMTNYKLTLNILGAESVIEYKTGEEIKLVDYNPSKEGYTFEGWFYDSVFSLPFEEETVVNKNVTLYAKMVPINSEPLFPEIPWIPEVPSTGEIENVIYDDFQIHFLEVGNEYTGDSTYIKAGDVDILIDAGSRKNSVVAIKEYIDKYCTDGKLEYVIGTHGDQDHIAGFVGSSKNGPRTGILYQYEIGTMITASYSNKTTQIYEDYLTAVEKCESKGTKVYDAGACYNNLGDAKRVFQLTDDISMEILYNKYYFEGSSDENNYSVCTMFNYNDHHFMLTGDLEIEGEEAMAAYYDGSTPEKTLPHVDLLKAGHHGSKTSTNDCLLKLITPDIVCVCCCAGSTEYTANYNNVFPTQDMITRVAKYTDAIYVTTVFDEKTLTYKPLNGTITVSCNGSGVAVSATNNVTKLKDTEWFNETVYVDSNNNICSGKGEEDFFTINTEGVTAVPRRVWPS